MTAPAEGSSTLRTACGQLPVTAGTTAGHPPNDIGVIPALGTAGDNMAR